MKKSAAVQLQNTPIKTRESSGRRQRAASEQRDSEARAAGVRVAKPTDRAEPMQSRSPARSMSWIIEQDGLSLPSTTSDVAIASVRSKQETALLDVRAAAWSKILKNDLPVEKVVLTSKPQENIQATSISPATTVLPGVTPNTHLEPEELATIGPWESASQVARTAQCPREPRSAFSRYFALPQCGESGLTQPMVHLANDPDPFCQLTGIDGAYSSNAGDTTMGSPQVHEKAGVDHQDGDVFPSASANTSSGNKSFAFPEERISASQTPSLDLVNHVIPDDPRISRRRSRVRRRQVPWHNVNSTAENILFQQYGLDPTDAHCEGSRPFLYDQDDSKAADASNSLGDPITLGHMQDRVLNFRGENDTEGLEGNSEDQPWHNECYPATVSESHVVFTPLNASYNYQGGAPFLQDTGYDEVNKIEDCNDFTSVSISSTDGSIFLEDDASETANNHLWPGSDEAWARADDAGGNDVQGGCSYLTSVQRVEQDVAKKLKDHWFPQKF